MNSRKITALLLSGAMALSVLTGCGGVNKDKTVATLNGEPVKLGVANFAARFGQAGADDFYTAYFGKNVWTSDLYGNGTTGQDNFKDSVMDSLEDMYVLQLHMDEYNVSITDDEKAAITAAAAQFMEDNSKDAINALGATQEIVEEYLTLETIQSKMKAAIVAGADTNVTDEEAKTGAYSYVGISKTTHQDESGNTVDYTDEEKEELAAKVADFAKAAKEDGLDAAAEDAGYTVSTGTFTQEDDSVDDNLLAALKNLKEGEVTDLIDGDSSYFVARLDKEVDEDATEETRQSIIEQRKDDLYDETLDGWKEGIEWAVKEKVWDDVNFDNLFTTIKDTETESTTEQATE